jgi:prephenate dehydrogenase
MGEKGAATRRERPLKVAVIGGAGRMGSWFTRYFVGEGFPTILSDVRLENARSVARTASAELANTNLEAVEDADLVLVCTPIERIGAIIQEVAPHMKKGAVLAEICSVKSPVMDTLRRTVSRGIKPLSLHPMFGPLTGCLKGKTIVVVSVTDGDSEYNIARRMFDEAEIIVAGLEEHDRAMAVALSLTYFINMTFANFLEKEDLIRLKRLGGTTFAVQLALAESIVSEDPDFVASLLRENRFTERYVDRFIRKAETMLEIIKGEAKNFNELHGSLRTSLGRDPDYLRSDEMRYEAFKALRAPGSASPR